MKDRVKILGPSSAIGERLFQANIPAANARVLRRIFNETTQLGANITLDQAQWGFPTNAFVQEKQHISEDNNTPDNKLSKRRKI